MVFGFRLFRVGGFHLQFSATLQEKPKRGRGRGRGRGKGKGRGNRKGQGKRKSKKAGQDENVPIQDLNENLHTRRLSHPQPKSRPYAMSGKERRRWILCAAEIEESEVGKDSPGQAFRGHARSRVPT